MLVELFRPSISGSLLFKELNCSWSERQFATPDTPIPFPTPRWCWHGVNAVAEQERLGLQWSVDRARKWFLRCTRTSLRLLS